MERYVEKSRIRMLVKKIPGARALFRALTQRKGTVDVDSLNQQLQKILINQYADCLATGRRPFPRIADAGFRCHSQFEEDGIILYVLAAIGMTTRKVVEICCGDGYECMAANLILSHGYEGFLFDGDENNTEAARRFFSSKRDCLLVPPKIKQAWISKENINELLREIGASGEVDLFSLDIDGNDYYVWEALSEIRPRLCVFETHNMVPPDLSITIPYDPGFDCWSKSGHEQQFRSVSLLAMKKLSERKGYRLIGGHKHGFNVFFMRNDIGQETFPAVEMEDVQNNSWTRFQRGLWPLVKDMPWVSV
jgi:hypothetical protein